MAGTVTTDLIFFSGATGGTSDCDSLTDWSGTGLDLDTVAFVQGTGSIFTYLAAASTSRLTDFACAAIDIQNKVIYFWFALGKVGFLDTKALGGLRLRVEDASANWGEWYVAGSDTLPHNGFICHAVHTAIAFDDVSATPPDKAAITKVCIRAYGSFPGKAYTWVDAVRIGTGITIKGGTEASPATLQDIIDVEETVGNQWGVLSKVEGILYAQGLLNFGSTTAGEATFFKDTNQVLIFKTAIVPTDFFEMRVQGNATSTTKVYFGDKSGGRGISGCVFRSAGAPKFKFTAIDTSITDLGIYGCAFFDANTISLPAYSATREVLSTNFEACAMILLDTCIVEYCSFISADDAGAKVTDTTDPPRFKDSSLISCPYGVRIPNTGTYKFDNLKFSGSISADIDNTSGGLVTVNCVNGANPTTYTGNTTINNYVDVTVTAKDENQVGIQGVSVRVSKLDDNSVVYMNELTDVNGVATESINYPGAVNLRIRVRKSSVNGTRYIPIETTGAMAATGFTLTVILYVDGNL